MDPLMIEHYEYLLNIKKNLIEELKEQLSYLESEYELLEKTYKEKSNNE